MKSIATGPLRKRWIFEIRAPKNRSDVSGDFLAICCGETLALCDLKTQLPWKPIPPKLGGGQLHPQNLGAVGLQATFLRLRVFGMLSPGPDEGPKQPLIVRVLGCP